eukprot:snap_masked-scaffold_1-processed-gene-7.23-mRNA-1 protein AED:1.00 eAED:1.00 QI:0/0/0/0/1/1/2/0/62
MISYALMKNMKIMKIFRFILHAIAEKGNPDIILGSLQENSKFYNRYNIFYVENNINVKESKY